MTTLVGGRIFGPFFIKSVNIPFIFAFGFEGNFCDWKRMSLSEFPAR